MYIELLSFILSIKIPYKSTGVRLNTRVDSIYLPLNRVNIPPVFHVICKIFGYPLLIKFYLFTTVLTDDNTQETKYLYYQIFYFHYE